MKRPVVLALLLAGCGTMPSPTTIPAGAWGSPGLEMDVSASGAELTFCCATGKIPPPLHLDASGHFDLTGTYGFQAGPVPIGGYPPEPAHYTGTVDSTTLTLNVTTARFSEQTYTLTFGVHGPDNCFCPL